MTIHGKITDPKNDPLAKGPDAGRELFMRYSRVSDGFSHDDVMKAALNMVVNCVRQTYPRHDKANERIDQLAANCKQILDGCYDNAGNRRSVFPFDQVIRPELVVNKQKFNGH